MRTDTMRLAFVMILMTMVAVGLVHIRRAEIATQAEIQRMEARRVGLRRDLWNAQVRLADKLRPDEVRRRSEAMALDLHDAQPAQVVYLSRQQQ